MFVQSSKRKFGTTRGSPRRSRTAKALGISRTAAKSERACEWDGWGRLSDDGLGQNNPNRSEDPWGAGCPGPILRYRWDLRSQTHCGKLTVGLLIRRMVTNWTTILRMLGASLSDWRPGRSHLTRTPSSRTGENPPYGMIEGIVETSASFEARSAPRSYSPKRLTAQCLRGLR
jgi:hypothetical protein